MFPGVEFGVGSCCRAGSQHVHRMAGLLRRCWRSYTSAAGNAPWIGDGLKFRCTQCGKCCTGGRERVVWVSEQEAGAIAGSLGLDSDDFADRYLQPGSVTSAGSRLSLRKNSTDTACIFLHDGKCSVYRNRPTQCRTYPFWPEPLTSRHDWEAEALRCEGIQTQTSLPLHHHRQHHNVAVEVAQSEAPAGDAEAAAQLNGLEGGIKGESACLLAGNTETAVHDVTVPVQTIKQQLVLEEISRSGELGGSTYSDMDELLTSVSPELVDEFADDFFANRGRKVLHDSKRWRVLDTWIGNPAEHFRSLVLKACPGYAQTEVQLSKLSDGSMVVCHDKLCQPAHKAMCLAFALQAMSQKHMHSATASSLHRPISVHDAQAVQPSSDLAVAVVGAGACALPMAIRHYFPRAAIDAVDIDAEALDLAQCFFGTQEDAHLLLHPEDGVTFLTKHGVISQFDVIMLDVAAPDPSGSPGTLDSIPAQFLSDGFIEKGLLRRLRSGGIVAINILGGLPALKEAVSKVAPHFQHLHALCTPELNILFGRAALGSNADSNAGTALWRVTAAAAALKPLAVLCDEVLSEQLEQWAINDELHQMLKSEFGCGWFAADELLKREC